MAIFGFRPPLRLAYLLGALAVLLLADSEATLEAEEQPDAKTGPVPRDRLDPPLLRAAEMSTRMVAAHLKSVERSAAGSVHRRGWAAERADRAAGLLERGMEGKQAAERALEAAQAEVPAGRGRGLEPGPVVRSEASESKQALLKAKAAVQRAEGKVRTKSVATASSKAAAGEAQQAVHRIATALKQIAQAREQAEAVHERTLRASEAGDSLFEQLTETAAQSELAGHEATKTRDAVDRLGLAIRRVGAVAVVKASEAIAQEALAADHLNRTQSKKAAIEQRLDRIGSRDHQRAESDRRAAEAVHAGSAEASKLVERLEEQLSSFREKAAAKNGTLEEMRQQEQARRAELEQTRALARSAAGRVQAETVQMRAVAQTVAEQIATSKAAEEESRASRANLKTAKQAAARLEAAYSRAADQARFVAQTTSRELHDAEQEQQEDSRRVQAAAQRVEQKKSHLEYLREGSVPAAKAKLDAAKHDLARLEAGQRELGDEHAAQSKLKEQTAAGLAELQAMQKAGQRSSEKMRAALARATSWVHQSQSAAQAVLASTTKAAQRLSAASEASSAEEQQLGAARQRAAKLQEMARVGTGNLERLELHKEERDDQYQLAERQLRAVSQEQLEAAQKQEKDRATVNALVDQEAEAAREAAGLKGEMNDLNQQAEGQQAAQDRLRTQLQAEDKELSTTSLQVEQAQAAEARHIKDAKKQADQLVAANRAVDRTGDEHSQARREWHQQNVRRQRLLDQERTEAERVEHAAEKYSSASQAAEAAGSEQKEADQKLAKKAKVRAKIEANYKQAADRTVEAQAAARSAKLGLEQAEEDKAAADLNQQLEQVKLGSVQKHLSYAVKTEQAEQHMQSTVQQAVASLAGKARVASAAAEQQADKLASAQAENRALRVQVIDARVGELDKKLSDAKSKRMEETQAAKGQAKAREFKERNAHSKMATDESRDFTVAEAKAADLKQRVARAKKRAAEASMTAQANAQSSDSSSTSMLNQARDRVKKIHRDSAAKVKQMSEEFEQDTTRKHDAQLAGAKSFAKKFVANAVEDAKEISKLADDRETVEKAVVAGKKATKLQKAGLERQFLRQQKAKATLEALLRKQKAEEEGQKKERKAQDEASDIISEAQKDAESVQANAQEQAARIREYGAHKYESLKRTEKPLKGRPSQLDDVVASARDSAAKMLAKEKKDADVLVDNARSQAQQATSKAAEASREMIAHAESRVAKKTEAAKKIAAQKVQEAKAASDCDDNTDGMPMLGESQPKASDLEQDLEKSDETLDRLQHQSRDRQVTAAVSRSKAREVQDAHKAAKANLDATQQEVSKLQSQLQVQQHTLETATKARYMADDDVAKKDAEQLLSEKQLAKAQNKMSAAKSQLADSNDAHSELESRAVAAALKRTDLKAAEDQAQEALQTAKQQAGKLKASVHKASDATDKAEEAFTGKESSWHQAKSVMQAAQEVQARTVTQQQQNTAQLTNSIKAQQRVQAQVSRLKAELAATGGKTSQVSKQQAEITGLMTTAEDEISRVEDEHTEAQKALKQQTIIAKAVNARAQAAKAKREASRKKLSEIQAAVSKEQDRLQELAKERKVSEQQLEEQVKRENAGRLELQQAKGAHDVALEQKGEQSAAVAKARSAVSRLERASDKVKAQMVDVAQRLSNKRSAMQAAEQNLDELGVQMAQAAKVVEAAKISLKRQASDLRNAKQKLVMARWDLASSQEDYKGAQEEAAQSLSDMNNAQKAKDQADAAVDSTKVYFEVLRSGMDVHSPEGVMERDKMDIIVESQAKKAAHYENFLEKAKVVNGTAAAHWQQAVLQVSEAKAAARKAKQALDPAREAAFKSQIETSRAEIQAAHATQAVNAAKLELVQARKKSAATQSGEYAEAARAKVEEEMKSEEASLKQALSKLVQQEKKAQEAHHAAAMKSATLEQLQKKVREIVVSAKSATDQVYENYREVTSLGAEVQKHKQNAQQTRLKTQEAVEIGNSALKALEGARRQARQDYDNSVSQLGLAQNLVADTEATRAKASQELEKSSADLAEKSSLSQGGEKVQVQAKAESSAAAKKLKQSEIESRKAVRKLEAAETKLSLKTNQVTELENIVSRSKMDLEDAEEHVVTKSKLADHARNLEHKVKTWYDAFETSNPKSGSNRRNEVQVHTLN